MDTETLITNIVKWLGAELFVLLLPLCILYFQDESNKERITFNDE